MSKIGKIISKVFPQETNDVYIGQKIVNLHEKYVKKIRGKKSKKGNTEKKSTSFMLEPFTIRKKKRKDTNAIVTEHRREEITKYRYNFFHKSHRTSVDTFTIFQFFPTLDRILSGCIQIK